MIKKFQQYIYLNKISLYTFNPNSNIRLKTDRPPISYMECSKNMLIICEYYFLSALPMQPI